VVILLKILIVRVFVSLTSGKGVGNEIWKANLTTSLFVEKVDKLLPLQLYRRKCGTSIRFSQEILRKAYVSLSLLPWEKN